MTENVNSVAYFSRLLALFKVSKRDSLTLLCIVFRNRDPFNLCSYLFFTLHVGDSHQLTPQDFKSLYSEREEIVLGYLSKLVSR